MIAVIKGDIIGSRRISDTSAWLQPLKRQLQKWGKTTKNWDLAWGDAFQLEIADPAQALHAAFSIKASLKSIAPPEPGKQNGLVDVRMSIGIGEKRFNGKNVAESNGPAYVLSGEYFEQLKKAKVTLLIATPWPDFNEEMNLLLKLGLLFMDKWSVSSAELVKLLLEHPEMTQTAAGKKLGIGQSSVSNRWTISHAEEMLQIEKMYRQKLKKRLK